MTEAVSAEPVPARASQFYSNRQYNDAIKVLQEAMAGRPEADCGALFLMLGECHYLLGQHAAARPYFTKAVLYLPEGREKKLAEFRLPSLLYRVGDHAGALEKIAAFTTKYAGDPLVGKLLVYKMTLLAKRGASAEPDLAEIHKQIQADLRKYDHTTGMEADQILCDYYRAIGQDDKAVALYSRIVQNFRNVISELQSNKQSVPVAFEKAHDNAALQLGAIYVDKRQPEEARKWLENVRYDLDLKQKSRLLLGKIAFEQGDFRRVSQYLGEPGFIDAVPAGPVRSDMLLLLGLAEKNRPDGNVGRIEEYLRQVTPGGRSYAPAQAALGEIYFQKSLYQTAAPYFRNVLDQPDHADTGLYYMGVIHLELGLRETDPEKAKPLFAQASDFFNQLFTNYPLSPRIKQARERIPRLTERGFDVTFARSDEENLKGWQASAQLQKGRPAGAQALLSIARLQFKSLTDEATGQVVKPAHYAAAAAACDQLLDPAVYKGDGFDVPVWNQVLTEALYLRAQCEIAGVNPPKPPDGRQPASTHVPNASANKAIELFQRARQSVDPKQLDLVKGINLGLLESLFKADRPETRLEAEKMFAEMEANYGTDPRFQKLALDLADWYAAQQRHADAARQYAGVAERGKTLPADDMVKLRYSAGSMFSRAAFESQKQQGATTFAIQILPKDVVEIGDDLRVSHDQLQKTVEIKWPDDGRNLTAGAALKALSEASRIPFVWSPEPNPRETVGWHMANHRVNLDHGRHTVLTVLDKILDPAQHRLAFDIGLTGAAPTIPPPSIDDDPEARDWYRVIEIYDARQAHARFKPLAKPYGSWKQAHDKRTGVLLYSVLQRIEELTGTRVVWADGIAREDKLAAEFNQAPRIDPGQDAPCAVVLANTLDAIGLRYKIVHRQQSADLYEAAKDQFNKIRQLSPKSRYGEKSLFALALNFYNQQDYEKMKVILREYLKLFDNPSHEYYRQACFWVGWAFEKEKRYREACDYYARSAEERMVIYKPREGDTAWTCDTLRASLGHDAQFALAEPIGGELAERTLTEFADFIRLNAHVEVGLDNSVQTSEARVTRAAFAKLPAIDLFCDTLREQGLAARVENMDPDVAEKAYFRMASAYKKDNLMEQALENCRALLNRYPQTKRRLETQRMMLDVYKGLKDYRNVLALLDELKKSAADDATRFELEFEIGSIHFDMADYARAAETFKATLAQAKRASDRVKIREAYARSLYRAGNREEALAQFQTLVKDEPEPQRQFINQMLVTSLQLQLGQIQENQFPSDALKFVQQYEQLTADQRERLSPDQFARATWIYYVLALADLDKDRTAAAMQKLNACLTSPDDFLAADAGYRLGQLHMRQGEFQKAREVLEYLLFATRSSESAVRATFVLGQCLEKLAKPDDAVSRYAQLIQRYPISPYVDQIKALPVYKQVEEKLNATPTSPHAPN